VEKVLGFVRQNWIFGLLILALLFVVDVLSNNKGEIRRLRAERDSLQAVVAVSEARADSIEAVADSFAHVADSLRAIRTRPKPPKPAIPVLPPVCDTLLTLIQGLEFELDAAVTEAEAWRDAYNTQKEATDSLRTALEASQAADSVGTEIIDELKPSLLSKILPQPGVGLFAGPCMTLKGPELCAGVGITLGWRF
jgi:hypothetical protein